MVITKYLSDYVPSINSFSFYLPMYSKIVNALLSNINSYNSCSIIIIYEIDDSRLLSDTKSVSFKIDQSLNTVVGYRYLTTFIDSKSRLINNSTSNGISFDIIEDKFPYHIFYDDRCLQEERDIKIEKIIE